MGVLPVVPSPGQEAFRTVDAGRAAAGAVVPAPAASTSVESAVRVTKGAGTLPNDHGQQWREYDIRPYTSRVSTTARPEQAVVDWILRETGTEIWFTEPLGVLNANRDTLTVYHTPEMQQLVQDMVERFVSTTAESQAFGLRLVTVTSPNWRSRALGLMRPVSVQSPGVEAWLLSKENAVILLNELRNRTDFRELNSPNLVIHNGQSHTVTQLRPRHYAKTLRMRENAVPAYELEMGQIQEGYSLQISPLMSRDQRAVDAVVKCYIDQVEKLVPVSVETPGVGAQRQTVQIQVPQIVSWRLHERFRWPTEQVLLLSCGVVATPTAERSGFPLPAFLGDTGRADALVFVEWKGKADQVLVDPQRTVDSTPNYRGRY